MATPHVTGIIAYAMANATLAANPALMKDWLRATALRLPDGTLMANNGIHTGETKGNNQGLLDFSKKTAAGGKGNAHAKRDSSDVDAEMELHARSALSEKDVEEEEEVPQWKRARLAGVEQEMACRREAQLYEDTAFLKGSWLCNTRSLKRMVRKMRR